jgi:hypothetical protein
VTAPARLEHTHSLEEFPETQGCPACMRLGRVNPDTGSLWPSLDEHGEQVVEETAGRFHDRYDGDNHDAALTAALTEAYQRGRMRGRLAEADDARRKAARYEGSVTELTQHVAELIADDPADPAVKRSLSLASRYADMAAALREQAGNRGTL